MDKKGNSDFYLDSNKKVGAPVTLSEGLLQAQKHEDSGIVYVLSKDNGRFITYSELIVKARKVASGLKGAGLKANDVVVLQITDLEEYIATFWGCLLSGVTPLTVAMAPHYNGKNGHTEKLYNAWDLMGRQAIITDEISDKNMMKFQELYDIQNLATIQYNDLIVSDPIVEIYQSEPDEVAFIQLSSGSTGISKCIPETHRKVIKHIHTVNQVVGYSSKSITLNWLPFDHVVPLLMFHVRDVYLGAKQVQLPTEKVLSEPLLWLDAIEKYSVNHTWSPNFAYKLINDQLYKNPERKWELSCVESFCNAGEQVTLPVVREFIQLTQRFGLKSSSMLPAFGMAETATVTTFCLDFNEQEHAHHIRKDSLNSVLIREDHETVDTVTFIDQGKPSPDVEIRITDKEGNVLPEMMIGRVEMRGEVVLSGYLRNEKANKESFAEDDWFITGDLGFMRNGSMTITGREKDLIQIYGANYYCADIENVVSDIDGTKSTFVAATGVRSDSGTEDLAIFYVPEEDKDFIDMALMYQIKTQVSMLEGLSPTYIVPMKVSEFPKTTSGKIQRAKLSQMLLDGYFNELLDTINEKKKEYKKLTLVIASSEYEMKLEALWEDVLSVKGICIDESFFALGGSSFQAMMLIARVEEEFKVEIGVETIFAHSTIRQLADYIEKNEGRAIEVIPSLKRDTENDLKASLGQEQLYFLYQMDPDNPQYNIPATTEIRGNLDVMSLMKAIDALVVRHESLRTHFDYKDGQVIQKIASEQKIALSIEVLSGAEGSQKEALNELIQKEVQVPFDMNSAPLLKVRLYQLNESHYVLLLLFHHSILDGWSMGVVFDELAEFYRAIVMKEKTNLFELPIQFYDYSHWQRGHLTSTAHEQELTYWVHQLDGMEKLDLLSDRARTNETKNVGARHVSYIEKGLHEQVVSLGQSSEASSFMVMMSAFMTLCAQYTQQEDIAIATAVANRGRKELESVIGFITNTIVMRGDLSGNPSFDTVLHRIKNTTIDAFRHQEVPFGSVVGAINPERVMGENPLAQVAFVMQKNPEITTKVPGLEFSDYRIESGLIKMNIEVNVYEEGDRLRLETEYNTALFDEATIAKLMLRYQMVLESVVKNPLQSIHEIDLWTKQDYFMVQGAGKKDYPFECFHQKVEKIAQEQPDRIALEFNDQEMNYGELNARANQLARYLKQKGVDIESLVGLSVERSFEMIISILAIQKAGGAYVSLDPAYPNERLEFIIKDTAQTVMITKSSLLGSLPEVSVDKICLDLESGEIEKYSQANLNLGIKANNLAYVIYTSGSTGKPKGVLVEHGGLSNLIESIKDTSAYIENDKALQFSSINFDASVYDITKPLSVGATLVLMDQSDLMFGEPLYQFLKDKNITSIVMPTSVLVTLPVDKNHDLPLLKTITQGGEVISEEVIKHWRDKGTRVINAYGPTEGTVAVSADFCEAEEKPSIGYSLANIDAYIVNKKGQMLPPGISGELVIGGAGVARGYLNRSELTNERFIENVFKNDGSKMYRTGDKARYLLNGKIEYLGRLDDQIKIRGFRVEIGEIESCLKTYEGIEEAFIDVNKNNSENIKLDAYVIAKKGNEVNTSSVKQSMKMKLPAHMVPAGIYLINEIPLTHNGKLDSKRLSELRKEIDKQIVVNKPINKAESNNKLTRVEAVIVRVLKNALEINDLSINGHFFDSLGVSSLGMVSIHKSLEEELSQKIELMDLFEYPTAHELACYLCGIDPEDEVSIEGTEKDVMVSGDIAIIGLSGQFPNAGSVDEFWSKIRNGEELIQEFTREELLAEGIEESLIDDPNYVSRKGALKAVENFDAKFFGYTPKEAKTMDPQHRLFLEETWKAFENAGYDPYKYPGRVSVIAGAGSSATYYEKRLQFSQYNQDPVSNYQLMLNNSPDFIATRTAHKFNFKGMAFSAQSACSTSLMTAILGCNALLNKEVDLIVTGGSSVSLPVSGGYLYHNGMILSPDGHCKTFDKDAQGTVIGNATGVVLLKRLEDALRDRDMIYAVIKGSAINNDGNEKAGFSAPSPKGQAKVIVEALEKANVPAESIDYVEAHGTATPMGDPIEIRALKKAWKTDSKNYCAIGSVKSNTGHCDSAAGVVGLIKTACVLHYQEIPASLHYEQSNPEIDFKNSPFYVNTQLKKWRKKDEPMRAAVSSFGMGGTNTHMILEQSPAREKSSQGRDYVLLMTSAKSKASLDVMKSDLIEYINKHSEMSRSDIAYTTQAGRHAFEQRQCFVISNDQDNIDDNELKMISGEFTGEKEADVIFTFSGQGSQYVNAGKNLYERELVYKKYFDACADELVAQGRCDIRDILYPQENYDFDEDRFNQTEFAQLVIFAIEYSVAKTLMSWGIIPKTVIGHSLGEYGAACIAGVMSLSEALKIVAKRAELMQSMGKGSMLSVMLTEEELTPYLGEELNTSVINSANRMVVSGNDMAIDDLETRLKEQKITSSRLKTSHAYHSYMMAPMLEEFAEYIKDIEFKAPEIEFISTVTTKKEVVLDKDYWVNQIISTVRFSQSLDTLYKEREDGVLIEVGPGNALTSLARSNKNQSANHTFINTIRGIKEEINDNDYLMRVLAKCWIAGIEIDWSGFYENEIRYRVPLPTYPFEKDRFWIEDDEIVSKTNTEDKYVILPYEKWFSTYSWERESIEWADSKLNESQDVWVVFMDDCGVADNAVERLKSNGQIVISIYKGEKFLVTDDGYTINPDDLEDFEKTFSGIKEGHSDINHMLYYWSVTKEIASLSEDLDILPEDKVLTMYALYNTTKSLLGVFSEVINMTIVTNNGLSVLGKETLDRSKTLVMGANKVIPVEYKNINTCHVDIDEKESHHSNSLVLEMTLSKDKRYREIAYRNGYKWVEDYKSVQVGKKESVLIKKKGTYILLGGLGGIGMAIASDLAKQKPVNLVFTSRSQFPKRADWNSWLKEKGSKDRISSKLIKLMEIEKTGSKILMIRADVANYNDMKMVFEKAKSEYGTINGIIHTAGVPGAELIHNKTKKGTDLGISSKVKGVLILDKLLESYPVDFMVLSSSIAGVMPVIGQVDYTIANLFIDNYIKSNQHKNTKIMGINWDSWLEDGMGKELFSKLLAKNEAALKTVDGVKVFNDLLNNGSSESYFVSTSDLKIRLNLGAKDYFELDKNKVINRSNEGVDVSEYTQIERKIADVFSNALGLNNIGLEEDFFEIGGDSLAAVQMTAELGVVLNMKIDSHVLFNHPTVKSIIDFANKDKVDEVDPLLVELRKGDPGKEPVFLFHPVGGSVYIYKDLAKGLDTDRRIYGVQAQGLMDGKQPLASVSEMIDRYIEVIRQVQPEGTYYLGGSSFGGMLAFEMAQLLKAEGNEIGNLFMLDTPGTGHYPESVFEDDLEILLYLLNIKMDDKELESKLESLNEEERLSYFIENQQDSGVGSFKSIDEVEGFLIIFKVTGHAMIKHKSKEYDGSITFFLASEKDDINDKYPHKAWINIAKQGVDVYKAPGDHISMNHNPNINFVINILNDKLK